MATTRIIPMHINKGKTISQCLEDRTNYAENPDKTEGGTLISSFACDPKTAAAEFALSKRTYRELTGRAQLRDIIAYQVRQSFKPGEITPDEANKVGYEFAERFTKGKHAFIVCTHTDKRHIHNHIIWNSTALDCTHKFRDFWGSTQAVMQLSDLICIEHHLSVVENPHRWGLSYNKWLGEEKKLSQRDQLRFAIDGALQKKPKDFEQLLQFLKEDGYTVKPGKHLAFSHQGLKRNIRLRSLGEGYSEAELRAVLDGSRTHTPFKKKKYPQREQKATLISEIEAKMNSGKGVGYEQWAKVFRLKQMAKTVLYLEQHGFTDYEELSEAVSDAKGQFNDLKDRIKQAETRIAEIQTLRTHIINYSKTREVYAAYRKSGYSKKFLSEHEGKIILHKAAKKAFDELGLEKLPTVKTLNAEFATLLSEKKAAYANYRKARDEMQELEIHQKNVALILGKEEQETQKKERQREEK